MSKEKSTAVIEFYYEGSEEKTISCYCSECQENLEVMLFDGDTIEVTPCSRGCNKRNNMNLTAETQYESIIEIIKKSDIDKDIKEKLLSDIELDYMINWK